MEPFINGATQESLGKGEWAFYDFFHPSAALSKKMSDYVKKEIDEFLAKSQSNEKSCETVEIT